MNRIFSTAQNFVSHWEGSNDPNGGLVDNPKDKGGITKHGVSIVFLTDFAAKNPEFCESLGIVSPITADTIRGLTSEQATLLFKHAFWDNPLRLDEFPPYTAIAVYDMAVNSGNGNSVKILQRACNLKTTFLKALAVDGLIGPETRRRVFEIGKTDDKNLALAHIKFRREFLESIVKNNPSQKVFLKGWNNRVNALERLIISL